jgi:protein SCO1/2
MKLPVALRQSVNSKLPANIWLWPIYIVLGLLILGVFAFVTFKPIKVLPRGENAPGFVLQQANGQRLTEWDLLGVVVLYQFTYTGCGSQCEAAQRTLQQLEAELPSATADRLPVKIVSISFDPQHDTPDVLRAYATQLGANPETWVWVTGETAHVKQVVGGGFGVYFQPEGNQTFTFDQTIVLVDDEGLIRRRYRNNPPTVENILADLQLLNAEAQAKNNGTSNLMYEAAHLFMCYPE